ncbi:type IV secretion system DNA-binding domain-containing protein [Bradyrhizobium sp. 131]|uniref:type IV secretory system conjugative DNA transfer family protein n=1 Tax=Bradyrhizobium sp. 131 TaxID=2782609 RepID=UPI001FFE5E73|nr:type IV secretion system DNA-binding domain-containing protein [Bradyrhizobium sp. 131]UPK23394.1 type IV secretion system DNA-binding domain-containing protein [Bradyrhizobium sp. 131]
MSNVKVLRKEAVNQEEKENRLVFERLVSVVPTSLEPAQDRLHRISALTAFHQLSRGDKLTLRYLWSSVSEKPQITIALEQTHPSKGLIDQTKALVEKLELWLEFLWPGAKCVARPVPLSMPLQLPIVPKAYDHWAAKTVERAPVVVSGASDLLLEEAPWRQLHLSGAMTFLRSQAPIELNISLTPFIAEARDRRCLATLMNKTMACGDESVEGEARFRFLNNLCAKGQALRIAIGIGIRQDADSIVSELVCHKLFGCALDPDGFSETQSDLRCVWPLGNAMPQLLIEPPVANRGIVDRTVDMTEPGALTLGVSENDDHRIALSDRDRARHMLMMGGTGTGKSTLLLNCINQDIMTGEAIILIDPHGDLADEVRAIVPEERQADVVWCDFSAVETIRGINILEMTGGLDSQTERSIVANGLVNLFKSILYRDINAFGPMWDNYFRNALLLLMGGAGDEANLVDFERVFHDKEFRRKLLQKCDDAKVREFWMDIVPGVSESADHSLGNMTPYVTSKIVQLTGNSLVRRFISPERATLDLRKAMDTGQIVLIKLAKGIIGELDTKLIATLLSMRIMQSGMARANMPPDQRRPCRLYFDEYQNAHGEPLAALLAESRKYGISVTLANQSLGQVTGRSGNDDAGNAALANAANLIVFRLGAIDAAHLAPWLQPEIKRDELMRLPDFHAVARVLSKGRPVPPRIMRTLPPPVRQ